MHSPRKIQTSHAKVLLFGPKKYYGEKIELLFTDTDSFILLIETKDVYEDMLLFKELYDNSDYPKDSKFYHDANKKVVGKMKDECAGKIMVEYVGLRPKMYSFIYLDNETMKGKHRAKGIQKSTSSRFRHEHYIAQLQLPNNVFHTAHRIGASLHEIYT